MVPNDIRKCIDNFAIDICIYENTIEHMKRKNFNKSDLSYKIIEEEKLKTLNKLKFYCKSIGIDYQELLKRTI